MKVITACLVSLSIFGTAAFSGPAFAQKPTKMCIYSHIKHKIICVGG